VSALRYLQNLSRNRIILWCYFIWYLFILFCYFDTNPRLWLTSLGLSAIVGVALYLSSTTNGGKLERWQTIRLFMMPFCVSSFSALVKGKGFFLIFSPRLSENFFSALLIGAFLASVTFMKRAKLARNG
jgi:hypothetical protein